MQIIIDLDEAHGKILTHEQSAKTNCVCMAAITNTVKLYSEKGIEGIISLGRNVNSDNVRRKFDGRAEARIIEIACSPAPKGHSHWTLRLLEEQAKIVLDVPVSNDMIGRALKNKLRPHMNDYWCILSKEDAEFVACMEDVLDVYELRMIPWTLLSVWMKDLISF